MLTGIETTYQPPLDVEEPAAIGRIIDDVNRRFGANAIGLGSAGIHTSTPWEARRELLSPRATTRWEELLNVWAGLTLNADNKHQPSIFVTPNP
jgi:DNA polymerase V